MINLYVNFLTVIVQWYFKYNNFDSYILSKDYKLGNIITIENCNILYIGYYNYL